MKLNKTAYGLIYRARQKRMSIDTRNRTVFSTYDTDGVQRIQIRICDRLCKEFGFVIQLQIQ